MEWHEKKTISDVFAICTQIFPVPMPRKDVWAMCYASAARPDNAVISSVTAQAASLFLTWWGLVPSKTVIALSQAEWSPLGQHCPDIITVQQWSNFRMSQKHFATNATHYD